MTESQIQRAVCRHLRHRGVSGLLWFHVPNGGWRDVVAGARLKGEGVLAGVADLLLFHNGKSYALELKTDTGRPSEAQLSFKSRWENAGGHACIARGLDRAIAALESWGLLLK